MNLKANLSTRLLLCAVIAVGVGAVGCGGADPGTESGGEASSTDEALAWGARLYMVHYPGGYLRNDANQAIAWIPAGGWVTYYGGSLGGGVVVNWRGMVGHAWGPYFSTSATGVVSGGG
jgi:hypothetical protein